MREIDISSRPHQPCCCVYHDRFTNGRKHTHTHILARLANYVLPVLLSRWPLMRLAAALSGPGRSLKALDSLGPCQLLLFSCVTGVIFLPPLPSGRDVSVSPRNRPSCKLSFKLKGRVFLHPCLTLTPALTWEIEFGARERGGLTATEQNVKLILVSPLVYTQRTSHLLPHYTLLWASVWQCFFFVYCFLVVWPTVMMICSSNFSGREKCCLLWG